MKLCIHMAKSFCVVVLAKTKSSRVKRIISSDET